MNAKLDALLDTLDNIKHPKEMVAVIHCNPYKFDRYGIINKYAHHSIPGANTSSSDTVALVEVDASLTDEEKCEKAFTLTNNAWQSAYWESTAPGKVGTVIDYWWSNDGVTLMTNAPVRSTSMGDQMLLQNGKKYTCEATGWTENAD